MDLSSAISFTPHVKQAMAAFTVATEILYGGAAGGGKSFFVKFIACLLLCFVPDINVYIMRRNYTDLEDNYLLGKESLETLLEPAIKNGTVHYDKQKRIFKNVKSGAFIRLFASDHETDIEKHLRGKEIHVGLIDEATLFTPYQVEYIRTRLRMNEAVKQSIRLKTPQWLQDLFSDFENAFPRIYWLTNPTGPSHGYFKTEFLDDHNEFDIWQMYEEYKDELIPTFKRQFIPAKIKDNPSLDEREYAGKLLSMRQDRAVGLALLEGDWTVNLSGLFNDVFRKDDHVIPNFIPPYHWKKWTGFDWGSTQPFAHLWLTEADGETPIPELGNYILPRGTIIVFMEAYGIAKDERGRPIYNTGLKWSPQQCGDWFNEIEEKYRIRNVLWQFAGGDLWNYQKIGDMDYTKAHELEVECGRSYTRADSGPGSRKNGWENIRSMLRIKPNEEMPRLFFCERVKHLIRTISDLPRDPKDDEDADTEAEDHAPDALRYGLMPIYRGKDLPSPAQIAREQREQEERDAKAYGGFGDPLGYEQDPNYKNQENEDEIFEKKPQKKKSLDYGDSDPLGYTSNSKSRRRRYSRRDDYES